MVASIHCARSAIQAGSFRTILAVSLLAAAGSVGCGGGYYTEGKPATSEPTSSSTASSAPAADSSDGDFASKRDTIRRAAAAVDDGTAALASFVKESTGKRTVVAFVDLTAPEWKESAGLFVIVATAKTSDNTVLGHMMLGLPKLEPGVYEGSPSSKAAVLAVLLGEPKWDGKNPGASWSVNTGSYCKVTLRDAGSGNLEGEFSGKLVDNKGDQFVTIDTGYVFINKR